MDQQTWYYVQGKKFVGPISERDLASLIKNKVVPHDALVFSPSMTDWQQACSLPEFFRAVGLATPATRKRRYSKKEFPNFPPLRIMKFPKHQKRKALSL